MDRYVVREPRVGTDYPNQIIAFAPNAGNNTSRLTVYQAEDTPTNTSNDDNLFIEEETIKTINDRRHARIKNMFGPPETMYFGGYGAEINLQRVNSSGFMGMTQVTPFAHTNLLPGQGQVMSGIDPRYLSAYSDNNASFIAAGPQRQQMHIERDSVATNSPFASDCQNRNFAGVERNKSKTFPQTAVAGEGTQRQQMHIERNSVATNSPFASDYQNRNFAGVERNKSKTFPQAVAGVSIPPQHEEQSKAKFIQSETNNIRRSNVLQNQQDLVPRTATNNAFSVPAKQPQTEVVMMKNELQNQTKTRIDKLKALHKSGPRAFSGPVEKVLKWHKALQDIGVLVLYEIVAKCVNVRQGESCSKNLVVRDDNGPAMQVVYYEIDFLLPELKPPCTVRVIGRMVPGTCRLQAFHVRTATGDDVALLPRRAAVAAHHVNKCIKEFNVSL